MTTPAQTEANRENATRSTGPKTRQGKANSAKNAVQHGLRSELAVLPFEQADAWEGHRDGVMRSLAPVGTLEENLAGRVALCLWRLQRVAAYEAATAIAGIEAVADEAERRAEKGTKQTVVALGEAADDDASQLRQAETDLDKTRGFLTNDLGELTIIEQVAAGADDKTTVDGSAAGNLLETADGNLPASEDADFEAFDVADDAFLLRLGVPKEELSDCWEWEGWTLGMVRRGIAAIAAHGKYPADRLTARTLAACREGVVDRRQEIRRLGAKVQTLRRRLKATENRKRLHRLLPDDATLNKVLRYESHLSKQMLQSLHTLERLQAARGGSDVPPPAALDVTVDGPTLALENAQEDADQP